MVAKEAAIRTLLARLLAAHLWLWRPACRDLPARERGSGLVLADVRLSLGHDARLLDRHKDWDGDPYEALMVEYIDPTSGQPVFKTITFFAQMLRPGERTQPLRADREPSGRAVRRQRAFDRRWPTFRLEGIRHARGAGRILVRARQQFRQGSGLSFCRKRRADLEEARPVQEMGHATKTMRL